MFECWREVWRTVALTVKMGTARRRKLQSTSTGLFHSLESLESRQLLSADGIFNVIANENSTPEAVGIDQDSCDVAAPESFSVSFENADFGSETGDDNATENVAKDPVEPASVLMTPRILNGTPIGSDVFSAVGITGDRRDPSGFGTGTLIASQWVLTAGHVSRGVGAKSGLFFLNGVTYHTVRVIKHPKFHYGKLGTDSANDISLWKLATPVVGVTPAQINRQTPHVGDELTLVGYGSGGNASGESGGFGIKRQGMTPIDAVSNTLISWDFDHPDESNTGHGDSGGPAFITQGGTSVIAGITSGGEKSNSALGDHSYDTRVDVFADWIDSTISRLSRGATTKATASFDSKRTETVLDVPRARSAATPMVPRIINGNPVPDATFPTVVKVHSQLGDATATLIAPQWVLTAAHCSQGIGNTDGTVEIGGVTYHTVQVVVHPKYNPARFGKNGANDIALWKLDQAVPNITPSAILRKSPKVGQMLTLVGFGLGGDATGQTGQYGTKRAGETRLDGVSSKVIYWNFDVPTEANTAGGDSGGPAFVQVGGAYLVAGVTSGGTNSNGGLGDKAVDTKVSAYAKWIDATIAGYSKTRRT